MTSDLKGNPTTEHTAIPCCESLTGRALAWHRYSAHGGPYPRRPRKARAAIAAVEGEA